MDRRQLGDFLRTRRERITPADVGLPAGRRRRTPGLRREEVAHLAFISTEYYTRLEQARGPHPSLEVLAGLARALRLSDAERDHLHELAGAPIAPAPGPPRDVRPSIHDLIRRLPLSAAFVTSAMFDVLAWNDLAAALMEDFSAVPRKDRNLMRRAFLGSRNLYGVSDREHFARSSTQRLRRTAGRYPDDPDVRALISDLLASERFAELWASHDVDREPTLRKTFEHPLVGPVTVNCDALDLADQDQQVVIYTADPGSRSEEALRLLSVVGTQRMNVTH
ncbi:helix-turn-helix transcriptional regulator [Cryptosporangium phraense]|uniref:Helix-turn-helix domain-containing protein n=1 Tax=Cryptosporangium phraense TaxID=2593070 RepID=A0A545AMN2_9ACTN|nr:helix-turn-helix transcriptional regulator [Cryptosporangium phraense]TQS42520.1 helix-turn-helix domain-containing protein [Cryptosporangium phraense]